MPDKTRVIPADRKLYRAVQRAYRQQMLSMICTLDESRFGAAFGMDTVSVDSGWEGEDYYHFRDNGGRVLAVAHLDTVVGPKRRKPRFTSTERGPMITSGALDDRLGAYVILGLLPKLGVTCDWLLTVGEESGASTAEGFKAAKDYDHVIEFDRMGTDVVMYQYEDRASVDAVEAAGVRVGTGSYSDIAYLEHLGVKAFNWGVGYRGDYHSVRGYAHLNDTFMMVAKYLRFYEQNTGLAMPHEPRDYGRRAWWDEPDDDYAECDTCGERCVDSVTWYCTNCGMCADCGAANPDVAAEWNDPDVDVCQCYTPGRVYRDAVSANQEGAHARASGSWNPKMTWEEYLAQRPDRDQRSPSIAPSWSEHAPARTAYPDSGWVSTRTDGSWIGWHEAAGTVPAHQASQEAGANLGCLRCAARWPHPVTETRPVAEVHPERACEGCERCDTSKGAVRAMTGAIHVIAAHPATEYVDNCARCQNRARWIAATRAESEDSGQPETPGMVPDTELFDTELSALDR